MFNASGDPVVVVVSYFYVYLDDKLRKTPEKRAAALLKSLLAFRDLVESYVALRSIYFTWPWTSYRQKLEPDRVKQTPLAMSSFKWLYVSDFA